jgi:hypothetical protein
MGRFFLLVLIGGTLVHAATAQEAPIRRRYPSLSAEMPVMTLVAATGWLSVSTQTEMAVNQHRGGTPLVSWFRQADFPKV